MTRTRQPSDNGGIRAPHDTQCAGCNGPIVKHESWVFAKRGDWLHVGCDAPEVPACSVVAS